MDRRRIARGCQAVDDHPTGIAEPEQLGHLVEGLARGIIARGSKQGGLRLPLDAEKRRVSARDQERDMGKGRGRRILRVFEVDGREMAAQMVHANDGLGDGVGQGLAHLQSHQKRPHQPGPAGGGYAVEITCLYLGLTQGLAHDLDHGGQVLARGHLGHNATVLGMKQNLRRDDAGTNGLAVLDDSGRSFVTRGFDSQNQHGSAPVVARG